MVLFRNVFVPLVLVICSCSKKPADQVQALLDQGTGVVKLPPGTIEVVTELRVPPNAHDLEIVGEPTTVIRAGREFQGRALLSISDSKGIRIRGVQFDGNRTELDRRIERPPAGTAYAQHFTANGVLISNSSNIHVTDSSFREVLGFSILGNAVKRVKIEKVRIEDSGSRTANNKNNTTGGILLEEGSDDFEISGCELRKISGNGIWTHSYPGSPRNYRGLIARNSIETVSRYAIQVGHANKIRVEDNRGKYIGYPASEVEQKGTESPAAIAISGKVDESVLTKNRFEDINGRCFDLDGFHDGEVSENTCINRGKAQDYEHGNFALMLNNTYPEMESQLVTIRDNVFDGTKLTGMFIIGKSHKITGNKLLNINKAGCNEGSERVRCPQMPAELNFFRSGIFLAARADRASPAEDVLIEGNEIRGHKMATRCIMTSSIVLAAKQQIGKNLCADQEMQ